MEVVLLSPQHPILLGALFPGEQKVQAGWPFVHDMDATTDLPCGALFLEFLLL